MDEWGNNKYPNPHDFIGINCSGKDTIITFPIGFHGYNGAVCLSKYIDGNPDRFKQFRDDARLLVDVLLTQRLKEQSGNENGIDIMFGDLHDNNSDIIAPAQAWYFLINDFLSNGYWSDPETVYREERSGKIDWKRTIKGQVPYIQNDNAIFLNFVVRQTLQSESSLISSVHKWCVYESFMRLGWLFSNYMPDPPDIRFQHELFLSAINDKLGSEFDDIKRLRLICMRAVVLHTYEENSNHDYQIGTNKFEDIWEAMVDQLLGTEFNKEKEKYYPNPMWCFANKEKEEDAMEDSDNDHRLRPDTIMKLDRDLIVIDAKYRKFYRTGETNNLPWAPEINKQITYGEYAQKKYSDMVVYNAFILPFDSEITGQKHFQRFGLAHGDWKNIDNRYAIIQGIFMDTKYLMKEYMKFDDKIKRDVADLIKNETEEYIRHPKSDTEKSTS